MLFKLFKKSKSFLGIDIGTTSIKIAQLGKEGGRAKLDTYGSIENIGQSNNAIQTSSLKLLDSQVAGMIKKIMKEAGTTTNVVTMSVPVFSSFTTLIELPAMPRKEIESAISFQARQYIPVPISDVILDWEVVDEEDKDKKGKIKILLIAVPKEVVGKYSRIATLAGLNLQALEIEMFSLVRSVIGNDKSPIALVDIGARSTGISIIDGGKTRFVRNIDTGGAELTRAVRRGLSLSFDRAEILKKEVGLMGRQAEEEVSHILANIINIVISEIESIISLYEKKEKKIEKIIISGGAANLPGFVGYIAKKLGIEVSLANPFSRVAYPHILSPILKEIGPSFSVAVGLAMRKI